MRLPSLAVLLPAACLGLALAVFAPLLGSGFVWDDFAYIRDNLFLDDPAHIPLYFVNDECVGLFAGTAYYRPLTTTSFALDKLAWGDWAGGYHATNLLLHLGACLLLFLLARRLTGSWEAALGAGILFAVHPVNVEPVAWIAARADLLCGLFLLASFLAFPPPSRAGGRTPWPSLLAFLLALASKEVAVILPALLFLHLLLAGEGGGKGEGARARLAGLARPLFPYLLLAAFYLVLRLLVLGDSPWEPAPLSLRAATAGATYLFHIAHAFLPLGLRIFYDMSPHTALLSPLPLAGWALAAVLGAAPWLVRRRFPVVPLGVAWFLLALLPASNLPALLQPSPVADRYLYIPLLGLGLALAGLLAPALRAPAGRRLLPWALAALALGAAFLSSQRVPLWKDQGTLFREAERHAPDNPYVLINLGNALLEEGKVEEAERVFLRLPGLGVRNAAIINLARCALAKGDTASARDLAEMTLQVQPSNPAAVQVLALTLHRMGETAAARRMLEEAVKADPYNRVLREALAGLER